MTIIESTNGQQPNSGDGAPSTPAANPTAPTGTDPGAAPGQGDGGTQDPPAGGDKSGEGDPPKPGEGANTVPESYDFKVPDGFVLEGERLELATAIAKDLKLDQDGAQKLVDTYVQLVSQDAAGLPDKLLADTAMLEPILEAVRRQDAEKWGAEAKAELGDRYDENVNFATTAVRAVNDPKLLEEFNRLGWGNHPQLLKAFAFFGRVMRDSPTDGIGRDTSTAVDKPLADRMYPQYSEKK